MNVTMKQVEGGVCAAAGFSANGLNCGLNPDRNKNDLALIWSEKECTAAAVYTTNKVKGAPILVTKKFFMDNLQLEESEYALIRDPQRGSCLYKCGNERYLLQVQAPEYKQALFGTAGGR